MHNEKLYRSLLTKFHAGQVRFVEAEARERCNRRHRKTQFRHGPGGLFLVLGIEGDRAAMFGVFTPYEQQLLYDWIAGDWQAPAPADRDPLAPLADPATAGGDVDAEQVARAARFGHEAVWVDGLGVVVFAFRPGSAKTSDEAAQIPLKDD